MARYLRDNPSEAKSIEQEVKDWNSANPDRVAMVPAQQEGSSEDERFAGFAVTNPSQLYAASSSTKSSLHPCAILDGGTNVHIINDAFEDRIIERRPATTAHQVYTGNGQIGRAHV